MCYIPTSKKTVRPTAALKAVSSAYYDPDALAADNFSSAFSFLPDIKYDPFFFSLADVAAQAQLAIQPQTSYPFQEPSPSPFTQQTQQQQGQSQSLPQSQTSFDLFSAAPFSSIESSDSLILTSDAVAISDMNMDLLGLPSGLVNASGYDLADNETINAINMSWIAPKSPSDSGFDCASFEGNDSSSKFDSKYTDEYCELASNRCRYESENTSSKKRKSPASDPSLEFAITAIESEEGVDPIALKRIRNTEAARRSRQRKTMKMDTLSTQVSDLENSNNALRIRLAVLENEKAAWNEKEKEYAVRIVRLDTQVRGCHTLLAMGMRKGIPEPIDSQPASTSSFGSNSRPSSDLNGGQVVAC